MKLFTHWKKSTSEIVVSSLWAHKEETFDIIVVDKNTNDFVFQGWVLLPKNGYTPIKLDEKYTLSLYFTGLFVSISRNGQIVYERDIDSSTFNDLKLINLGDFQIYSRGNEIITAYLEYKNDFWEFDHMDQFSKQINPTGLILDIGANIGNHSLMFRKYYPSSKILAFEPLQYNWEVLQKNVSTQPNIDTFKVALSDKLGIVKINNHFQEFNSGAASISDRGESVVCMPLDYLGLEDVSFMKIDVEGWESYVIRGAIKTIEKNKPVIWLEDSVGETIHFLTQTMNYHLQDQRGGDNFLLTPNN